VATKTITKAEIALPRVYISNILPIAKTIYQLLTHPVVNISCVVEDIHIQGGPKK